MGNELNTVGGAVATAATSVAAGVTMGQVEALNGAVVDCAKFTADAASKTVVRHVGETVGTAAVTGAFAIAAGVTLGQVEELNDAVLDLARRTTDSAAVSGNVMRESATRAVDSVPVVGHIKGGIQYAIGDVEGADRAMKSATQSTGFIAGGIVGAHAGPAGMIAGGFAGAAAANKITSGVETAAKSNHTTSQPDVVGDAEDGLMLPSVKEDAADADSDASSGEEEEEEEEKEEEEEEKEEEEEEEEESATWSGEAANAEQDSSRESNEASASGFEKSVSALNEPMTARDANGPELNDATSAANFPMAEQKSDSNDPEAADESLLEKARTALYRSVCRQENGVIGECATKDENPALHTCVDENATDSNISELSGELLQNNVCPPSKDESSSESDGTNGSGPRVVVSPTLNQSSSERESGVTEEWSDWTDSTQGWSIGAEDRPVESGGSSSSDQIDEEKEQVELATPSGSDRSQSATCEAVEEHTTISCPQNENESVPSPDTNPTLNGAITEQVPLKENEGTGDIVGEMGAGERYGTADQTNEEEEEEDTPSEFKKASEQTYSSCPGVKNESVPNPHTNTTLKESLPEPAPPKANGESGVVVEETESLEASNAGGSNAEEFKPFELEDSPGGSSDVAKEQTGSVVLEVGMVTEKEIAAVPSDTDLTLDEPTVTQEHQRGIDNSAEEILTTTMAEVNNGHTGRVSDEEVRPIESEDAPFHTSGTAEQTGPIVPMVETVAVLSESDIPDNESTVVQELEEGNSEPSEDSNGADLMEENSSATDRVGDDEAIPIGSEEAALQSIDLAEEQSGSIVPMVETVAVPSEADRPDKESTVAQELEEGNSQPSEDNNGGDLTKENSSAKDRASDDEAIPIGSEETSLQSIDITEEQPGSIVPGVETVAVPSEADRPDEESIAVQELKEGNSEPSEDSNGAVLTEAYSSATDRASDDEAIPIGSEEAPLQSREMAEEKTGLETVAVPSDTNIAWKETMVLQERREGIDDDTAEDMAKKQSGSIVPVVETAAVPIDTHLAMKEPMVPQEHRESIDDDTAEKPTTSDIMEENSSSADRISDEVRPLESEEAPFNTNEMAEEQTDSIVPKVDSVAIPSDSGHALKESTVVQEHQEGIDVVADEVTSVLVQEQTGSVTSVVPEVSEVETAQSDTNLALDESVIPQEYKEGISDAAAEETTPSDMMEVNSSTSDRASVEEGRPTECEEATHTAALSGSDDASFSTSNDEPSSLFLND